jgi:amino acid transporter
VSTRRSDFVVPGAPDRAGLATRHLAILLVSTAAPLTVLSSGVSSAMRASGLLGVAVLFLVLTAVLLGFAVAYRAVAKNIAHAGGFYPYVCRAFGPGTGLGAAAVALLGYNAMAIGVQGLLGAVFVDTLRARTNRAVPWWLPVVVALIVIGAVGTRSIRWSVWISGALLVLQLGALLLFDSSAIASPGPEGYSLAAFNPASLLGGSVAVAASFAFVGWVGVETASTYSEELRSPQRTMIRATLFSVALIGGLSAFSIWALTIASGPSGVVAQAKALGTDQVPTEIAARLGTGFGDAFNALLVASLFATALCFHNLGARQFGALARDGVLPSPLGRRAADGGAPYVASVVQTVLALVVVVVFAVVGADPRLELFAWLSNLGATCVLLLLALVSLATIVFLLRSDYEEGSFFGWEGPVVAAFFSLVTFGALFALSVAHFNRLLGVPSGSPQALFLPGLIPILFVVGLLVGRLYRVTRPEVVAALGLPVEPAVELGVDPGGVGSREVELAQEKRVEAFGGPVPAAEFDVFPGAYDEALGRYVDGPARRKSPAHRAPEPMITGLRPMRTSVESATAPRRLGPWRGSPVPGEAPAANASAVDWLARQISERKALESSRADPDAPAIQPVVGEA